MVRYWIQGALRAHKKGSLHKQLGVPQDKRIPKRLLSRIKTAPIGKTIRNPARTGKRRLKVTGLLKKRAVLAHTLGGLKHKRHNPCRRKRHNPGNHNPGPTDAPTVTVQGVQYPVTAVPSATQTGQDVQGVTVISAQAAKTVLPRIAHFPAIPMEYKPPMIRGWGERGYYIFKPTHVLKHPITGLAIGRAGKWWFHPGTAERALEFYKRIWG